MVLKRYDEATSLKPFLEVSEGEPDPRRVFTVRSDRVRSQVRDHEMTVDRLVTTDWVNVVAIARDDDGEDKLLCVRQWRFGSRSFSLELPAGLIDPGEDPRNAALRELREETGYAPAEDTAVMLLGETSPNAAFMGNTMFTYLVPHAVKVAEQDLDENEEVEVCAVPVGELEHAVRRGAFINGMSLVALYRYSLHLGDDAAP